MKKVFFGLLFLSLLFLSIGKKMNAYTNTGHSDFRKITFVREECHLLKDYRSDEIDDIYGKISRKSFGWSTYYLNMEEEALYEGVTIFSRANSTSSPIVFDYSLKDVSFSEVSVTISGSVSAKISGSIKKVTLGVQGDASAKQQKESSNQTELKTSQNFVIQPGRKLTMIITGVCYVTTGVSVYRFFGIRMQKGAWEKIDVDTIVYEVKEETI